MFKPLINIYNRCLYILKVNFGLDFKKCIQSLMNIKRFVLEYYYFKKNYDKLIKFNPSLNDYNENAGDENSEYFINDLFIAQKIYNDNPAVLLDIGSRLDGYIAHVASFREINVLDIRPFKSRIHNIFFHQADLMKSIPKKFHNYADYITCIHSLEHFGLGRYGDTLNPDGYKLGLKNISKILKKNGTFVFSVPIGKECVEFNSHRIFNPFMLIDLMSSYGFKIINFFYLNKNKIIESTNYINTFNLISNKRYVLGTFIMTKIDEYEK